MKLTKEEIVLWSEAIALRLTDEWDGADSFKEDALLLKNILAGLLSKNPDKLLQLIGTGIIEESYFEDLIHPTPPQRFLN
jgi:hypothetical protein